MSIVDNKKAFFDYFIEERFEAGLVLEGWEVKAIRAGRVHIKEAYVVIRKAELFLIGCHITPLLSRLYPRCAREYPYQKTPLECA
jgi:SsrA-binding protein